MFTRNIFNFENTIVFEMIGVCIFDGLSHTMYLVMKMQSKQQKPTNIFFWQLELNQVTSKSANALVISVFIWLRGSSSETIRKGRKTNQKMYEFFQMLS